MDDASAGEVRRQAMAQIEKEATDKNGLRNDVVTLYQGGQYHLYTYKKYTDVRLVFAPEFDIAFFGGDPDNFEYPRYDLDVCFFRAYEDGKPAKIEHYLEVEPRRLEGRRPGLRRRPPGPDRPAQYGGQPRVSPRRPLPVPARLPQERRRRSCWITADRAPRRPASRRKTSSASRTAARRGVGGLEGLRDAAFMKRKAEAEAELRARIKAAGKPGDRRDAAWDRIAEAQKTAARIIKPYFYLERGCAFDSNLFDDRPRPRAAGRGEAPSPTPSGSRSTASRASSRSSCKLFSDGADLSRVRGGQAGPLAGRLEDGRCPTTRWSSASSAAARPPRPPRSSSTGRSWPTSRSDASWPRAA